MFIFILYLYTHNNSIYLFCLFIVLLLSFLVFDFGYVNFWSAEMLDLAIYGFLGGCWNLGGKGTEFGKFFHHGFE